MVSVESAARASGRFVLKGGAFFSQGGAFFSPVQTPRREVRSTLAGPFTRGRKGGGACRLRHPFTVCATLCRRRPPMSDKSSAVMDRFYPTARKCLSRRSSAVTSNDSLRGSNGSSGASNDSLPSSNGSMRSSNDSARSSNGRVGGSNGSVGASSGSLPSSSDWAASSNHSLPLSNGSAPLSNDRTPLSNHLNRATPRKPRPAGDATAFTRS